MVCVKCGTHTTRRHSFMGGGCLCKTCYTVKAQSVIATAKAQGVEPKGSGMKRGEIQEVQASSSYQRQWVVQGSAREPYKVSLTKSGFWLCSCPAGRTTPGGMNADPCKHCLVIQVREKPSWTTIGVIAGETVTRANGQAITTEPEFATLSEPTGRRFR